ncbi:hypothetical protein ACH4M4_12030 [Streptomyces sp. NPDC017254]|uniref:hypothetical protein n=1 Tax=unclassified Streptomyces TaxID=2593676 RepID=UPI0037A8A86E
MPVHLPDPTAAQLDQGAYQQPVAVATAPQRQSKQALGKQVEHNGRRMAQIGRVHLLVGRFPSQ